MKILVTGGSGFIGSHVVDVLAARGYTPVIFDRAESPHHAPGAVETVIGEVTDTDALERALAGCEAVIHLAAMADVGDVQKDPEGAELANSRGTLAVLEGARRAEVKRIVYGSTIWVYSDCDQTAVDEETALLPPSHLYTATKLAGELYCRSYAELYGAEYTVLRFGIPYGPRARPAAVVPMFVGKALRGEPLTVAGDGSQGRRFVYVEDLADGIVRGLRPQAVNRVYNLAGTETTTILDIAQTVQGLIGDTEIVHTPARPGDFGGKEVSSERALTELGWAASTPFAEGVRRYVDWRRASDAADAAPQPVPTAVAASASAAALAAPAQTPETQPAPATTAERGHRDLGARLRLGLRAPRVRPVLSAVAVSGLFFWSFATDDTFPLLANTFRAKPQTSAKTSQPEVGLLVKAPERDAPAIASRLSKAGAHASFALEGATSGATLSQVRAAGSDAMPQLKPGGLVRWLATRSEIRHTASRLGVTGHVYYALPKDGLSFGQDVLGHTAGATPVAGAVNVQIRSERGRLRRGAVVEVSLNGPAAQWSPVLDKLVGQLRSQGLGAVPADTLLRRARR